MLHITKLEKQMLIYYYFFQGILDAIILQGYLNTEKF